ncbi:suppressor of fused domain protein [Micromonosporaceae bacterium Da 78-11]
MSGSDERRVAAETVEAHVRAYFAGHEVENVPYDLGFTRRRRVPEFRMLVVGPGPRGDFWTYITLGCWSAVHRDGQGIEFMMTSSRREETVIEVLAMVAYYHATDHLDHWHTMPIGRPWLPGSACDHLLVSLPYLHGPELEVCDLPGGQARLLWLLPITAAEKAFRQRHDTELLERCFDDAEMDPTDPLRASVV